MNEEAKLLQEARERDLQEQLDNLKKRRDRARWWKEHFPLVSWLVGGVPIALVGIDYLIKTLPGLIAKMDPTVKAFLAALVLAIVALAILVVLVRHHERKAEALDEEISTLREKLNTVKKGNSRW